MTKINYGILGRDQFGNPYRPADIALPEGWTWEKVEAMRKEWDIPANMVPIVVGHGAVGWGTINSVRLLRGES